MQIPIAGRCYQLLMTPRALKLAGKRVASLCDHANGQILISSLTPPELRPEVAALATAEAWQRETIQRPPLRFVGNVS